MLVKTASVGNPKFGVGDSFPCSPAKARRPSGLDPQTIGFRANALNSRGIVVRRESRAVRCDFLVVDAVLQNRSPWGNFPCQQGKCREFF
jgi:hypothetical protein